MELVKVGKGGTVHATEDGTATLCGKQAGAKVTNPGAVLNCKSCSRLAEGTTVKADVENIIEELHKLNKSDADKIKALQDQGLTEADKIEPVADKVKARMRVKEAAVAALQREPRSAEVAVRQATEDVTTIDGYEDIVDNAADRVAEGLKANVKAHEVAYRVAEAILDGRLRIYNKQGLPDLRGVRQASRDLAGNIYRRAVDKLREEGWATETADFGTLLEQLQEKVQYQMTAVLPRFARSLDNSPEFFRKNFPSLAVKAEKEGKTPSEIVLDHYRINPKSKAELAAERRARKKLTQAQPTAGELPEGNSAEETAEETQFDRDAKRLERIIKDLPAIASHAGQYSDEERNRLREQLTKAVAKLSEALAQL